MQSWIHVLEWRATGHPDVTALADDRGARYTYAELRAEFERRAGGWAALGIGPGNVVAIVAKNSAAFLVQSFALLRAGAIPAFVNWRLSPRELADVLALLEPAAVAADAEFTSLVDAALCEPTLAEPVLRAAIRGGGPVPAGWLDGDALTGPVPPRPRLSGEDILALVHTSGTTGKAKAIPLRHGALMMSVADFALEIGDQVAGSHHLQILPLFHLGGLGQCLQALLTAGTVHFHTGFDPAAVIDAIERDRIEFFAAGPSLIDMLVWHNDDLIEQSAEDNLKVLASLHRAVSGLRYDVIRRAVLPEGVLRQHVLRGALPSGAEVELHAAMYLQVKDGHITRIEEYLDSGNRASIRAAREALASAD